MRTPLTIAAALLAVAAIGCGGDDEPDGLSDAELTRQVNAACSRAAERIEGLGAPETDAERVTFAREADAAVREMVARLRELDGAGDAGRGLDRLLGAYDRSTAVAQRMASAARDGDDARAAELQDELGRIGAEAERTASDAGFDACVDW